MSEQELTQEEIATAIQVEAQAAAKRIAIENEKKLRGLFANHTFELLNLHKYKVDIA